MKPGQDYIPADIILELLGSVSFSKNEEADIQYAENIASNMYTSMKNLLETIEGCIQYPKAKKEFTKLKKDLPTNEYFKAYFESHP